VEGEGEVDTFDLTFPAVGGGMVAPLDQVGFELVQARASSG
jgi:hypothetical protein